MKTIKIINLLLKISNGEEVPKKIKYDEHIYKYVNRAEELYNYKRNDGKYLEDVWMLTNILNDEVEIIEDTPKEDKKIRKLNCKYTSDVSKLKVANKVDEIIELLNNSVLLSEKEVGKFLDKVNGE